MPCLGADVRSSDVSDVAGRGRVSRVSACREHTQHTILYLNLCPVHLQWARVAAAARETKEWYTVSCSSCTQNPRHARGHARRHPRDPGLRTYARGGRPRTRETPSSPKIHIRVGPVACGALATAVCERARRMSGAALVQHARHAVPRPRAARQMPLKRPSDAITCSCPFGPGSWAAP